MNGRLAALAARHSGRPVLMTPRSAQELAERLLSVDARAFERPGRLQALFRGLRGAQGLDRLAMEDDDGPPPVPFDVQAAYTPLYIGEAEDTGYCWALKDGIALMQADTALSDRGEVFCGTVYHGYDTLKAGMQDAAADPRVKAIFIRMASPGGVVAGGLPDLSAWMRDNREAAGGKPIHVHADMACSAAYWIAAQADHVTAPRVGLVGSIGAVIVHQSIAGMLKEVGVEITPIQFGAKKTDGAWWSALSDDAKADLQAEIDQCGRDFVADVVAGRPKLTAEALIATEAAVFMGHHDEAARSGLELGFVDEISGEEAAFAALAAKVSDPQSTGMPSLAAPGGRAAAKPASEQPMALRPTTPAAKSAAVTLAEAAVATAQANLVKARAESGAEAPADEMDDEETDDTKKDPEAADEGGEAEAIAASAEAQSHPQMALAAITSGQTLAQFQASVKAAGAPRGRLAEAMAGARRLGADAPVRGAAEALDSKAIYAARAPKARRGR
jgi:ClpP class serine protease